MGILAAMPAMAARTGDARTAAAGAAEDFSQWSGSAILHLNTAPEGADVEGNVTGFPLLVRLNKYTFPFQEAHGKGRDIRFSKPDGTLLPHQIERWDSAAAAAEIWVRVDTVRGGASDQELRIHWGRPGAEDGSDGHAVFDSADGWLGVWHMDKAASGERINSVAGGNPALPVNYEGDESRPGLLGPCDSLDGSGAQDHLDLGDGYADFSAGFTYSVWAAPTAASFWARLLDIGNGQGTDNLVLQRRLSSNDMEFEHYAGTAKVGSLKAEGILSTGEWQHIAVTVSGRQVRIYRNGALSASAESAAPLAAVPRTTNWIGKSNWAGDNHYRGLIDEPRIARRAEDPARIKLAYANQRAGQRLVSFNPPGTCAPVFDVPADTALGEGRFLALNGVAECASSHAWSLEAGPGGPLLDPAVAELRILLPRVTADTVLRYRFSALFGDSTRSADVTIRVREEIPDPIFTLPSPEWNGTDSLEIRPDISNWGAVHESRAPDFNYAWTLEGLAADTAWKNGGILLRKAAAEGDLTLGLCLDNGGTVSCKTTVVKVRLPVGLRPRPATVEPPATAQEAAPAYDVRGRLLGPPRGAARTSAQSSPSPAFEKTQRPRVSSRKKRS